ncbi:hypothetical protein RJO15_26395 [Herbaspirillum huttiense F1]|uniref:hypothetical protein n=1 Tax=Herbaspirillum huttiense TaxID=863372 RepID=UPI0028886B34|nr:hypothetical protein [Herbaspirillum huttiense]MDT0359341.1 hypothetical protein [Herbaspirillum huttiense F1]
MKISAHNDHFTRFPYRAEERKGERNNGGIDLLTNPEQIDLIHELAESPQLYDLVLELNRPGRPLMTLGCAYGEDDGFFCGYLDLSIRDLPVAQNELFIASIDDQFRDWLNVTFNGNDPALGIYHSFFWEYSKFTYFDTEPRYLISIFFRAQKQEDCEAILSWLHKFFRVALEPTIQRLVETAL